MSSKLKAQINHLQKWRNINLKTKTMKTKQLTKPEKRVLIAKDVIKLIKAKKIVIQGGRYFQVGSRGRYIGKQLKDILPKIPKCQVCALGGLFYSYVSKYNNYEIDDEGLININEKDDEMRGLLNDIFSKNQLYLIECAFEQSDIEANCRWKYSFDTITRAEEYRDKHNLSGYKDDDKALIHIMKNIISNKGLFKV